MICTCPKCAAAVEFELSQLPAEGKPNPCPACKSIFVLSRESFSRRGYHKASALNCVHCGGTLGSYINCPTCGVLYPDYYVSVDPKVARRRGQAEKLEAFLEVVKGFSFTLKPSALGGVTERPKQAPTASKSALFSGVSKRVKVLAACLVALVALGGIGGYYYVIMQARQAYIRNFIKEIYVAKSGAELCISASTRVATEWKAAIEAGKTFSPRLNIDEESRLAKVKGEVEKLSAALAEPPEKFAQATEALGGLSRTFTTIYTQTLKPADNYQALLDSTTKSGLELKNALQKVKSSLHEDMKDELTQAKQKFRGMSDF